MKTDPKKNESSWDCTDEASWESFPASDPPARKPECSKSGPSTQLKMPPPPETELESEPS
jgi:hypothetical protein